MHTTFLSIVISSVSFPPRLPFDVLLSIGGVSTYWTARYCISFCWMLTQGSVSRCSNQQPLFLLRVDQRCEQNVDFLLHWEQNAMDFHFYSKTWLQQLGVSFIRWGEEVIHHSTTWKRRMRLYWQTKDVIAALQLKLVITYNPLCNTSCAQVRQSCEYTRTLILPYAPMQQKNRNLALGLNGVSSVSITRFCNHLMITIKSSSLFLGLSSFIKSKAVTLKQ